MRHYEEREETVKRKTLVRTDCDICKKPIKAEMYAVEEVEISLDEGTHYDEGHDTTKTYIDCCISCFKTRVRPAIEAMGATFSKSDLNY